MHKPCLEKPKLEEYTMLVTEIGYRYFVNQVSFEQPDFLRWTVMLALLGI